MQRVRSGAAVCAAMLLVACASTASAVDQSVIEAQNRRIAIVDKVAPSVVAIFSAGGRGGGSGVLISADGYALTNFHVTRGAGTFMKCGLSDGKLYDAVVVGIDPTGDVALVRLLGRNDFPAAPLGDSDKLQPGDWAYAMGNPFLLATDFRPTVTYGIISGVHRYQYPAGTFLEYTDCIQIDTSINPGNSGGPLFNDDGELVGINGRGSFEKRGRVNSGAGYAISINQIKHFMDHLRSGRIVDHATLGATVSTQDDGSVIVNSILEESDAYRRGLRDEDEIVSFAGRSIRSVNQFKNILGIYPKGWKLPLEYRNKGRKYEILVRLRALHRKSDFQPKKKPPRIQPQPKPDGKKPKPAPGQIPRNVQAGSKAPAKYKHMYVKKDGYANYYFNQLEQKRLLGALKKLGDYSAVAGTWELSGKTEAFTNAGGNNVPAQDFTFTLADKGLGLELGNNDFYQGLGTDVELEDEPFGTGGLLTAMHHLRLMMTNGGRLFTKFYYLGSEPLDGQGDKVDVLISVLTGVESRWYFSKKDATFLGFDTRLTDDVDECEVRVLDFAEFDGRKMPGKLRIRRAGETVPYRTFVVSNVKLAKGKKPAAEKPAAGKKAAE